MAPQGDRPETDSGEAQTAQRILQTVTQDLKSLQQGLIAQLSQEVARLQAEKARLLTDIETLQSHQQTLHARQIETLSQQQQWARQLALELANQMQALIVQRLNQLSRANLSPHAAGSLSNSDGNGSGENAQRLLESLDAAFSNTFKTLQRDLNSYQSSLSQQLGRMQSMEQQGEAILEALIHRLQEQLHGEAHPATVGSPPLRQNGSENGYSPTPAANPAARVPHSRSSPPSAQPIPFEAPAAPLPVVREKKELSQLQLGLLLVLLSTVALSFHNVVVRIIGTPSTVLHLFQVGGFIKLGFGNSLLILWLRMLVVLPLMIPVAMFLYPPVWRDIKRFLTMPDRRPLYCVVGSGAFLFLSQILIYIAIGQIGPGVAVTILFMYPTVTVPLAWLLFGDRPTRLRWAVMVTISLGVILTAFPGISSTKIISGGGVLAAIASGIAFAFYLIFMQLGFKKLHPVPVSLVQFSTIFLLSSVLLILPFDFGVQVNQPLGFILGGIILGVLTLVGYLANNFGVRFMGAARASIIASSGPVMTALLAFWFIRSPLQIVQILGILLVTGGVTALSFERMKSQPAPKGAK